MRAVIAVLPGDGIGPEVIQEAGRVLKTIAQEHNHTFELVEGDIGSVAIDRHGVPFPDITRELVLRSNAVLLGAVGHPKHDHLPPSLRPERGLLDLRTALGNFANLRPVSVSEGILDASPLRRDGVRGVDLLIVRELLGGIYFGNPRGTESDRAFNTETYSRDEVLRVARVAFALAKNRRKKVVSVDKANVLESSALWRKVVSEVASRNPDIAFENMYVDTCAMQLIARPQQFDVILTTNMFGDILSDEAAMLTGSLGLLPSASIGGERGLFEPVHGSAPDLAGTASANPIGAILSAGMLLDHALGLTREATKLERAVLRVLNRGYRTPDLKTRTGKETPRDKRVSTREMGELVCDFIRMPDAM